MQNSPPQFQKTAVRAKRGTNKRPVSLQQSTGTIPNGYMTGEEFWKKVEEDVDEICRKHGIL